MIGYELIDALRCHIRGLSQRRGYLVALPKLCWPGIEEKQIARLFQSQIEDRTTMGQLFVSPHQEHRERLPCQSAGMAANTCGGTAIPLHHRELSRIRLDVISGLNQQFSV